MRTHRPAAGFTLVELMVSLTIGLLLTLGLVQVFSTSNESYESLNQAAQQIENGRYAVQTLHNDLQHAGYYGEYAFAGAAGSTLPDPCEISNLTAMRDAITFFVQGYDAPASSPIACLDSANIVPGTDIVVIRRSSTTTTALGAMTANEVYMQATADSTNASNPVLNTGSNAAAFTLFRKDGTTPAEIRKFITRIYFVSPCSVPASGDVCSAGADGGRPIPTLKRLEMTVNAATGSRELRIESIAEGIENLQIDYGVDTSGDGVPDIFITAPAAAADWGSVMSADIYVLARNIKRVVGTADTKTYNLGAAGSVTPGGNFKRHVFASNVRIVNPASRREEP